MDPASRTHGLAAGESRDPIGVLVAGLNRLAQSDLLDRVGLRKPAERAVFAVTRSGFRTLATASRAFTRTGGTRRDGVRAPAATAHGVFDLTPTEDEQSWSTWSPSSPPRWCVPPPPRRTTPARPPRPC